MLPPSSVLSSNDGSATLLVVMLLLITGITFGCCGSCDGPSRHVDCEETELLTLLSR